MEVVRVFNNELSSLYEGKPPISKAKMTQITKSAIKGIKFYKHIVQSVEKFIQKCRPEFKVPGLYVVDSIVRQSRHQFGAEKDVFGPRFVKNLTTTFQHLFRCPEDEKPKIIRVLNLWQKNQVFPIEIIQPLLDMGHPSNSNEYSMELPADTSKDSPANKNKEEAANKTSPWKGWPQGNEESTNDSKVYAEMSTKNLEKFNKAEMSSAVKEEDPSRSSMYKNQVNVEKTEEETVKFNKKLLDFDYGDEEDEEEEVKTEDGVLSNPPNALALSMAQNLLSNPELLQKLQQMTAAGSLLPSEVSVQPHSVKVEEVESNYAQSMQNSPQLPLIPPTSYQQPVMSHNLHLSKCETDTDDRVLPEPTLPTRDLDERSLASVMASHDRLLPSMCLPAFPTGIPPNPPLPDKDDRILPDPPLPSRDLDERSLASIIAPPALPPMPYPDNSNLMQFQYDKNGIPFQPPLPMMEPLNMDTTYGGVMPPDPHHMQNSQGDEDERVMYSMPGEPPLPPQDFDERQIMLPVEERGRKERSRSRSGSRNRGRSGRRRSKSRSPRRKRSRSRSRSRKNRSRSRERERIREKERERDRERDRRRKGIPPIKKGCVTVCSTTLWLGHVPKSCSEVDISDTFGQFGTILSIDMIPPRGCAYVVMDRRQDANRALQKLKNVKLQGSSIKMAWAPGKGVKGKEFKDCWEVDLGVSYVPYEKIKEELETLELLEEGGFIDEDSLSDRLKALRQQPGDEKHSFNANSNSAPEANVAYNEMPAAPNMVPPPIMPPTSVGLPMVLPHLMQPQFGLHLPGMLPPQAMVMQVPMGIPPPAPMLMVQQQSQGIMGNQPLSMVGGVPSLVPRTLPPVTSALANLKSSSQPESVLSSSSVPPPATTAAGDATPTEEEGTTVSSPSVQMTIPSSVSIPAVPSSQPVATMGQYNHLLGMHANRPIISVPPPVSTAGAPIPYPPPNVGFNFPPPGMRPPGQAHGMPPNAQFPWMQKQVNSTFADAASNQTNSTAVRPVPPPQPGMPPHMLLNRPPFHDQQSSASNVNLKEVPRSKDNKPNEGENVDSRNISNQHDKSQEMVISTDDESSMDIECSRNDMPPGFPPDFARTPMNMPRMRGPPGLMPPGPRFGPVLRGMGQPFPMRMGGPRGPLNVPGMHGRMEMEFDSRGPRIPMGPHGPRRNDNMHPPPDGRDWYPRDFEGPPPYERERERNFRDDWGREGRDSWVTSNEMEGEPRRNFRDNDDQRRDERREPWNRDRVDNSRPRDKIPVNEPVERKKDKPSNKGKNNKSLMDDLFKLRVYQRGGAAPPKEYNNKSRDKPVRKNAKEGNKESEKPPAANLEYLPNEKDLASEQNSHSKRERDREARKRSRWGRTLSEEREFQIQRQNEIEMKFRSYEQSHAAQHSTSDNIVQNTEEVPGENVVEQNKQDTECQSEINPSELNQSQLNPSEPNQCEINPSEISQSEVNPSEMSQSGVNSSAMSQSEENSSEMNQSEVNLSEISQSVVIPIKMNQSELNLSELSPFELNQPDLNPPALSQPELNPSEPYQSGLNPSDLNQSELNPFSEGCENVPGSSSDIPLQTHCDVDEQNAIHTPVQSEISMNAVDTEVPVEISVQNVMTGRPVQNTVTSEETSLLTDCTPISANINTDVPLKESFDSSKALDDSSLDTKEVGNNTTLCREMSNDLAVDSSVTDNTSKNDVLEDVNQNSSSLIPAES